MKPSLFVLLPTLLLAAPLGAQHVHINAGVLDANNNGIADIGEPLRFVNGAGTDANSSFFVSLTPKAAGPYAGRTSGNVTFVALAATADLGGPEPGHASLGTRIVLRLLGVTGPAGAEFSFWDEGATAPTFSLGVGATPASPLSWDLSENAGQPGEDPYGHIHGRQFTVDQPGTYMLSLQLFDAAQNGPGGTPRHAPSDLFTLRLVAVPEPGVATLLGLAAVGLFGVAWNRRRRKICAATASAPR